MKRNRVVMGMPAGYLIVAVISLLFCPGVRAAPVATTAPAAEYYVAVDGKADAAGTRDAPWDIASALVSKYQKIEPGATLWLAAGVYKHPDRTSAGRGYMVRLTGAEGSPIVVRPVPGARVTIDGGLRIDNGTAWLWIRDLEIMVSEKERTTKVAGSNAADVPRPWGGLEIVGASHHCKYINLVIHDNNQGCGFWKPATDSEVYGCLIYDNGWIGPDRGHGHCIYSQNLDGIKTIADNILCTKFAGTYAMHAYGSARADVDNYLFEGNIAFDSGPFLVGGGKPSHNIRVLTNFLYNTGMLIGYNAPENEDCEIRGNTIVNGSLSITRYKQAVSEDNLVLGAGAARPHGALAVLRPNKYDVRRANLVIFNWKRAPAIDVAGAGFIKDGEKFRLMDPKDFFGKPIFEGVCRGGKMTVPMKKEKKAGEFAVFVVLK